ncbi:OmpH family outer membrane protein [Paramuribaculum intestinale]|uniref:OmpH family outer membrane protein n=3 Tax=Paramuribaculum intestinale TaxID=2094151 RepID=A0A2V1IVD5_9BACT|nr:OmpH family outer membrane protein [Paramuribaculum intestinale]MBJ2185272.1 OmpH family outer membrane protein [Muribaculaceae bacterium]ROS92841.1 OmpH family outer membrane protein [Muribaculaceae bacterium Isolate-043 (Harlan)]MCX4329742.1 OmpH family outer membrane protein [Paramuribaculum intestinale]PWB08905.1 OmpH family outer membrane protein [Paramuribaculum intestinale]PWB11445.1 OmpH family outer membrane protein [Paramuribaculum intestinale]
MKRIALIAISLVGCALGAMAQKFALVDMEYVLKNIPAYEIANEQVNQMSLRWQKEVDVLAEEADKMYKDYQSNMVFLTDEQKQKREKEITAKEKAAAELRQKYFGPEGDLFVLRQKLMEPIQDEVYNAVKAVSEERGFQCIFDRASSADIIFASPRIDISNEVLAKLGYSK